MGEFMILSHGFKGTGISLVPDLLGKLQGRKWVLVWLLNELMKGKISFA